VLFVFDVNETLLDLAALDQPFAELTGTPAARGEWFDLLIHTALTFTAADGYQDFAHLAGECLATVAQAHGRVASDEQRRAILSALRSLPAHPDVPGGLGRLRDAGHRLVALTNSPLATARAQLEHAGIADRFERVFSAEAANALKPAPAAYRLVIDALGSSRPMRSWLPRTTGTSHAPRPPGCAPRFSPVPATGPCPPPPRPPGRRPTSARWPQRSAPPETHRCGQRRSPRGQRDTGRPDASAQTLRVVPAGIEARIGQDQLRQRARNVRDLRDRSVSPPARATAQATRIRSLGWRSSSRGDCPPAGSRAPAAIRSPAHRTSPQPAGHRPASKPPSNPAPQPPTQTSSHAGPTTWVENASAPTGPATGSQHDH